MGETSPALTQPSPHRARPRRARFHPAGSMRGLVPGGPWSEDRSHRSARQSRPPRRMPYVPRFGIAPVDRAIAHRQEHIALLHAIRLTVEQSLGPGKPAAGLGRLAANQRYETQPKSTACRPAGFSAAQKSLMRAGQDIRARDLPSDQVSCLREFHQIHGLERGLAIRSRKTDRTQHAMPGFAATSVRDQAPAL